MEQAILLTSVRVWDPKGPWHDQTVDIRVACGPSNLRKVCTSWNYPVPVDRTDGAHTAERVVHQDRPVVSVVLLLSQSRAHQSIRT